jgi:very-short-patch-repair endonuclease
MRINTNHAILTVAARCHGICTRAALLESGVSAAAIDRRLADRTLVSVRRGVYEAPILVDELTPWFRAIEAVPDSVLSRQTAASVHGFSVAASPLTHITAPVGSGRRHLAGIVVHETRKLDAEDVEETADGLPATTPARTIVDLAAVLRPQHLRHVVQTQLAFEKPSSTELQRCFDRIARRGRPGVAALRPLLDELSALDRPPVESELEALLWEELRRCGLQGFSPQFKPPWFDGLRGTVDFAHVGAAVILEADGRRWHARRAAMAEDRRRDRQAVANGWIVVRLMWEDVVHEAQQTFMELARIIESRLAERAA